uniref:Uncharacterized protein n=1 Tax=Plectus sambesii TaxID=2011161 RepID=A0A914VEM2_9BILA
MSTNERVSGDEELMLRLEAAHYQCMQKYLLTSGMGDWTKSDEKILGALLRLKMADTGQPLLMAAVERIKDARLQARYVEMFAHENVDVNARDDRDRTPLMICLERGFDKSAKHLIQSDGVDHFLCDDDGNIALHYAAKLGHTAVLQAYLKVLRGQLTRRLNEPGLKYLVHHDIFNIRNNMDETILDSAVRAGHEETAQLIAKEKTIHSILVNKKLGSNSKALKRNVSFESVYHCPDEQESDGGLMETGGPHLSSSLGRDSPLTLRKLWRRWRSPPPSPRPRIVSAVSRTEFFKNKMKLLSNRTTACEQPIAPSTPESEQWFPALAMRRRSVSDTGARPTIRASSADVARNRILRDPNGLLKRNTCLPPLTLPTKK